jgi:hypothetical protein
LGFCITICSLDPKAKQIRNSASVPVAKAPIVSRTQKFWASPAKRCPLKSLEPADLSFRLAVAPALSDRISHGVDISSQGAGKPLHCIEAGLMHVRQPDSELAAFLLRRTPRDRMASRRIAANSGHSLLSASTFTA